MTPAEVEQKLCFGVLCRALSDVSGGRHVAVRATSRRRQREGDLYLLLRGFADDLGLDRRLVHPVGEEPLGVEVTVHEVPW